MSPLRSSSTCWFQPSLILKILRFFLLNIFNPFNILEMLILSPKDSIVVAGSGKDNTICKRQFEFTGQSDITLIEPAELVKRDG